MQLPLGGSLLPLDDMMMMMTTTTMVVEMVMTARVGKQMDADQAGRVRTRTAQGWSRLDYFACTQLKDHLGLRARK
jgi:hypothetical protein